MICQHAYIDSCHESVYTDYTPTQVEKCETEFNKKCIIRYEPKVLCLKLSGLQKLSLLTH